MLSSESPAVLFLCTGNYYRSRTAEALFDHYARERGLGMSATSRGLQLSPDNEGPMSRYAQRWLTARGVPFESRYPLDLRASDLETAGLVVAIDETEHRQLMQVRFPDWVDRVTFWMIHDIDRTTPDEAVPSIDSHVKRLLQELSGTDVGTR